jgi:hypothetical protein
MTPATTTNRLAQETSPYLRQHATNPVDWYPWGPEALAKAKQENKPIFLSIGYSACHWCHVMEHESFVDPEVAGLLNEHFVSIKVDREERPDLDQIYMNAVVALTRHGGWPMTVFLTPDLQPFYAGTYFPPEDRHGLPSFRRVVEGVATAWHDRPDEIIQSAGQITEHLRDVVKIEAADNELQEDLLRQAGRHLERAFDATYGGFGRAPKFPHPLELKLLLRVWKRFQDESALEMAEVTLDHMARGGMYDQLAGGFHRYSTDPYWLVPHFEKMLYDNALLAQAYLEAFQATGKPFYRQIVEETLGWVAAEMTSPEGGFYSTQDADSEGEEGKFYVWSQKEVDSLLGPELSAFLSSVFDISDRGNWEGSNILHRPRDDAQEARLQRCTEEELRVKITQGKQKLLAARAKRIRPGRDEKILTAWNGLMISAFAQAGQVLGGDYTHRAEQAARFILQRMRRPDGKLHRTVGAGSDAKLNAYLEDYAFLVDGLLHLYEATFAPEWLEAAISLSSTMIDQFWDETEGGFFFVGKDHEQLILRSKEQHDNAVPAGTSVAVLNLLRLGTMLEREEWTQKAERTLQLYAGHLAGAPSAFGQMLCGLDFYLGPVLSYVLIAGNKPEEVRTAARLIQQRFEPNKILLGLLAEKDRSLSPLFQDKPSEQGQVTTYLCRGMTCENRLVGVAALQERLKT